ncbi:MAG: 2-hydroxyacid dehydrogenase [Sulfurovum sp. FS08-3]|nr:MAG: 2-hydroxyacid dehydrogenase [Sulfurovum sp. FS08-3]
MSLVSALIWLPFIGAIVTFVLGKRNEKLAFWSAYLTSGLLFVFALITFVGFSEPIVIETTWFSYGEIVVPFGFYIDSLALVMLLIATGLGFLDIHFSHDYMASDPHQPRYYAKVLFFIGGMIVLVSAKELTGAFVGWELMGLASYWLISFWHHQKAPADAGVSAFLFTKMGDIFLFAAMGLLFVAAGSFDFQTLNALATQGTIHPTLLYTVALFIFIAAIGKSGQFPLFPWLMRAMEGPTTVSALIHGATMVNSGIYIVARLFDFYVASQTLLIIAGVGALSAFIGASSALVQKEMKKILAYSTMSHLSLAFIGLGAGSLAMGMAHLTNHAIFKALLFLSAGAVIMSAAHTKDIFKLGGLERKMPLVALFMLVGAMSLSGIPPFSGFFSKDAIIASTIANTSTLIATFTFVAGLLSIAYITRLWVMLFLGTPRNETIYHKTTAPSNFWIALPLGIMAALTLLMGFYQEELKHFIDAKEAHEAHMGWLMPLLFVLMALLVGVVYLFYFRRADVRDKLAAQPLMKSIHQVLFNGYYIEKMIFWFAHTMVVQGIARAIFWFDRYVVDAFIDAVPKIAKSITDTLGKTHNVAVGYQSSVMLLGVVIVLFVLLLKGLV